MHELRIPLDPCNPGQFYACCGLVELAELSGACTLSHFEINDHLPRRAEFVVQSTSPVSLAALLDDLREADYKALSRPVIGSSEKDSIAPIEATIFGSSRILDWWLDAFWEKATSLKCWAGQVTSRALFEKLPRLLSAGDDPFQNAALTTTRFGIDPRSAWVALDLGYSPNEQGQESRTYPAVEMLAALGLQGFRPAGSRKLGYSYALWRNALPMDAARSACAEPWSSVSSRLYRFSLGERGSYKFISFAQTD